jgi:hypothetical protein
MSLTRPRVSKMNRIRVIVGASLWIAIGCLIVQWHESAVGSSRFQPLIDSLVSYWSGPRSSVRLQSGLPIDLAVGDPIFVRAEDGSLRQIGEISAVLRDGKVLPSLRADVTDARCLLFPTAPECGSDAVLTYYTTPDSLAWVVRTLVTPERRVRIADEIRGAYEDYHSELLTALQPILQETLRDSWAVIEQDLPSAIERRGAEIESLGSKIEQEIVETELIPLAKREIWPIVQRRSESVADEIGTELWERVSLWRFAWRAAYDRSPLPDRHLMEREWHRFVRDEAMPILSRHTDDMIEVVRGVIHEASHNEAVQAGVQHSLSRVTSDPEFQRLVWSIVQDLLVSNPRLAEVIERHWTGPEAQEALQLATERLEPTVRRISDLVFGTFEDGITPEFAQVLRTQILAKDRRWFLLDPKGNSELPANRDSVVFQVQVAARDRFRDPLRAAERQP